MRAANAAGASPTRTIGAGRGANEGATQRAPNDDLRAQRPALRPGLVSRRRLVARLAAARDVPVSLLVAPAGYGKTTVLAEWAERDKRPFAWVALDRDDADVSRLLWSIALALDEIEPVGDIFARRARRPEPAGLLARRLARSLSLRRRPFVLVLEDAHRLEGAAAFSALELLLEHVPAGSQIAIASRTEPDALRVGRLRAHGRLVELRPPDLAMTRSEAAALLRELGLAHEDLDGLVARTEGWPAGLSLAALSLRDQHRAGRARAVFAGDDRFVADYFGDELMADLPREHFSFLIRTSVLADLSGPLCDAVLGRLGSAATLRELSRSNLMVVPLDRGDTRYRYHTLFAEWLQAELRRLEPEQEPELHRRASEWHARNGDVDRAIHHAIAAGDLPVAANLLWRAGADHLLSGRRRLVGRWLDRFTGDDIASHPAIALTAATSALATGDRDRVEHWCAIAERGLASGAAAAPQDAVAAIAVLRAFTTPDGIAAMGAAAGAVEPGREPWHVLRCLVRGTADLLSGEPASARARLEEGARDAAVSAPVVQVLCLAQLAVLAIEDGDTPRSDLCVSSARRQVDRVRLGDTPICALVFAASALDRAHRGRVDDAKRDMRQAVRLLARLQGSTPWYDAEARVLLARAALRLGEVARARTLLAEASRLAPRGFAAVLDAWLDESWAQMEAVAAAAILGRSSLTTAELRVLRLLPTHLSLREIARALHVSTNTVKTHAHAVYRKLDASSRAQAVANGRRIGVLDA
jgi:LuxR family transcriptional regulator, maltose regulon positive regulatory protein